MNTFDLKNLKFALFLGVLFSLFACDDPRLDKMVDDSVYLANYGVHQQNIYMGEGFTYPITVVKAGVGQQSGTVRLSVSEEIISKYNGDYTLLPQQYYQIRQNEITLEKDDYQATFIIDYDVEGIQNLVATNGNSYAIPLELESINGEIALADNPDQCTMLLVPQILSPYIGFKSPGLQNIPSAINADSPTETKFYAFVTTNFHNEWDLNFEVIVDEELLNQYNETNGTSYHILSADAYRINNATFQIPNRQNESSFEYYLIKDKVAAGNYMLPLRITSVSKFGIDPGRSQMLIPISIN